MACDLMTSARLKEPTVDFNDKQKKFINSEIRTRNNKVRNFPVDEGSCMCPLFHLIFARFNLYLSEYKSSNSNNEIKSF